MHSLFVQTVPLLFYIFDYWHFVPNSLQYKHYSHYVTYLLTANDN